jgi:DNA-binding transcriptional LysR family regulator
MALTLRQIEAFRAVMVAGTMIQAAELLHVSQPAVSRLIADLERAIGYKLFHRDRGRLVPSDEGTSLFAEVQRAFVGLGQIESTARAIGAMQTGHLRIVTMPILSGGFLPKAVKAFLQAHPQVSISLEVRPRFRVLEWIASQQYDIGFATLPVDDPAIRVRDFACEDSACILPAGHPLAAKPVIHATDLEGEDFVSFLSASLFRFLIDKIFLETRVRRNLTVEAGTAEAVCNLVEAGVGLSVIGLFGLSEARSEKIAVRPFRPEIPVEVGVLFPAHNSVSRVTQEFADTAIEVYELDKLRSNL